MSSSDGLVLYGDLPVSYGQIYLNDCDGSDIAGFLGGPDGAGFIGVKGNGAVMLTGLHSGYVAFTIVVADQEPGSEVEDYEDVVEVSMTTSSDRFMLFCWGTETHDLSPLPAGASSYRLRYHARGMDAASDGTRYEIDDPPIDEYLLQVWPAPGSRPSTLKLTSRSGQYWQRAWRNS